MNYRPSFVSVPALVLSAALLLGAVSPASSQPASSKSNVFVAFEKTPKAAEEALVRAFGGEIRYTYTLVPAIAARIPDAAIEKLEQARGVVRVEPDIGVRISSYEDELNNTWGVKQIDAGIVHTRNNLGAGVKVAVLDSGIDYTHPDLAANYRGGYDFINNDSDPMDDHGHGTHVAGTVAAVRNGTGVVGVAPAAQLYGLKVMDASGNGYYSSVVKALEWCVANGIQVTNNSYGSSSDPGTTVRQAFDNAAAKGVLHVASAGNSGNAAGDGDNVLYPARFGSVIAVAMTDKYNLRISPSSTGPDVELAAPGNSIYSTIIGGGYGIKSGTSMASPHVAGVAALAIAAGVVDVRAQLCNTATDLGAEGRDPLYGYGLVNADRAAPGAAPPPPSTGTIAGTVTADDGGAIAGASVQVEGAGLSVTTGSDGSYAIADIAVGTYSVTASAEGFEPQTESEVGVVGGETTPVDFALSPIPPPPSTGTIAGTVTADGGGAIAGASVRVDGTSLSATTETDGGYSITNVQIGTYTLSASASGYQTQTAAVAVSEDALNQVSDFALTPIPVEPMWVESIVFSSKQAGVNLFLYATPKVVNDSSDPLAGVQLAMTVSGPSGSSSFSGLTGADGAVTFDLGKVSTGEYTATIAALTLAGHAWDPGKGVTTASYPPPESSPPSTGSITGTVTANGGGAIAGASVRVDGTSLSATTETDGGYSITNVQIGTYTLSASASGYETQTAAVAVSQEDLTPEADFALPPVTSSIMFVAEIAFSSRMAGKNLFLHTTPKVVDQSSGPLAGVQLAMTVSGPSGSSSFSGLTGADGAVTFDLGKVPAGEYTATIVALTLASYEWDQNQGVKTVNCLLAANGSINTAAANSVTSPGPEKSLRNFPNPANPGTIISYALDQPGRVALIIYNTRGQEVRTLVDQSETAGIYAVPWDGTNNQGVELASGIYLYRLVIDGRLAGVRKLTLMK